MDILSSGARRVENFTGTVWAENFLARPGEFLHGCIYFAPGARSFWHCHERGQILNVVSGSGLVCSAGSAVQRVNAGDVIWIPPGERHWHGAAPESFMVHMVTSFGQTEWFEAVADGDYAATPSAEYAANPSSESQTRRHP